MSWYERYGYTQEPFTLQRGILIDASANLKEPVEELAYNIEAGNMVVIEGEKGTGKTALLFSVIKRFKGKRNVIYFDCAKDHVDIKGLLQKKYGVMGKIFNITPKGMILLLDNFRALPTKELERAKYFFDHNYLRSIVFVGNGHALPDNIRDRVGERIINLKKLGPKDAVDLVKGRLGSLDLLPAAIVRKIYARSDKNTITFLENCRKVCEAAAKDGASIVEERHLEALKQTEKVNA